MKFYIDTSRVVGKRDPMIYGQFIEHFHRQIYGGIYEPLSRLSGAEGFREDVIEAMRRIKVPVLRWPGGCFVSAHHWKDAVGPDRQPTFDKAWRVEEPNTFGTDEYVAFCRRVGCAPYICTNAGSGGAEEMSDWVEYCNLKDEGRWARLRIKNGHAEPYGVTYWSVGNENYGHWEIGAKSAVEWGRLVLESVKMIKRVDPSTELSAAALADLDWNVSLLSACGERLDWISIHEYWDMIHQTNDYADYAKAMSYTARLDGQVKKVRGLLAAMGLDRKIRIAFDEWNLRGWYHPNIHTVRQALNKEDYLAPRDLNDDNSRYTMADAVFAACFLNMCHRNCDAVGMANFAPVVNTRGCIFTHKDGIVLRSTYHVFDLYVNGLGETVLDAWQNADEKDAGDDGGALDVIATAADGAVILAAVNKDAAQPRTLDIIWRGAAPASCTVQTLAGTSTESYNDIGHNGAVPGEAAAADPNKPLALPPHSVNVIRFGMK